MTVLFLGLWAVVWIVVALQSQPSTCQQCRAVPKSAIPSSPRERQHDTRNALMFVAVMLAATVGVAVVATIF